MSEKEKNTPTPSTRPSRKEPIPAHELPEQQTHSEEERDSDTVNEQRQRWEELVEHLQDFEQGDERDKPGASRHRREQRKDRWSGQGERRESIVSDLFRRSWPFGREGDARERSTSSSGRDSGGASSNRGGWFSKEMSGLSKEIAKEVAKSTLSQVDKVKNEAVKIVAGEVREFFRQTDIWKEARQFLDGASLEIDMKIRFRANDEDLGHQVEVERTEFELPNAMEDEDIDASHELKTRFAEDVKKPS